MYTYTYTAWISSNKSFITSFISGYWFYRCSSILKNTVIDIKIHLINIDLLNSITIPIRASIKLKNSTFKGKLSIFYIMSKRISFFLVTELILFIWSSQCSMYVQLSSKLAIDVGANLFTFNQCRGFHIMI